MSHVWAFLHLCDCLNERLMKYKLLILLSALCLLAQEAFSQVRSERPKNPAKYQHEWRFGIAGYPFMETLAYSDWGYFDVMPDRNNVDNLYKDYHGPRKMIGLISAEYSYNRNKHLTFAVGGYASTVWENTYNYLDERVGTNMGFNLSIMPTVRWKYYVREKFSMYGDFGFGVSVGYFEEWNLWPTFHFVPLGLTFGDKVYGFVEYGAGLLYIGGAAGIGYRF